ncbi:MAG TPA: HEAT repeat domain-containing protein [Thermomicrobiales bacterium]|nr:HEAT repeat domain-containing protein [Thermomicrobiales bacterium]
MLPTEHDDLWDRPEDLLDDEEELDDESDSDLDLDHIRIFTPDAEGDTDEDLDFEAASSMLPRVDLTELLETLVQGNRHVSGVYGFNDLAVADLPVFTTLWPRIAPELRLAIVTDAIEFATEDYRFDIQRFLLAASDDDALAVRLQVVEGLGAIHENDVATRLLDVLRDDVSDDVRAGAATSLGPFVLLAEFDDLDPVIADRMQRALFTVAEDEDESWHVRRSAAESAAAFGPSEQVGALIQRLWDEDELGLRPGAVLMIGRGNMQEWLPTVRELLTDDDPALRFEAIHAVGLMGDVESLPELSEIALHDEDVDFRHQAITSIGTIGGPRAARILNRLAEQAPAADQEPIANALREASLDEDLA